MKLQINPPALLASVKKINQVIDRKPLISILSNALFSFDNDSNLSLRGSNTEIDLIVKNVDYINVEQPQNFCVDSVKLANILTTLNDSSITIKTTKNMLSIKHSKGTIKLPIYDATEFPQLNSISAEAKKYVINDANDFRQKLVRVTSYTGNDILRPIMTNVLVEIANNNITLVASDTHKLIASNIPCETTGSDMLLIPTRASKLIADTSFEQIAIWAEEKRVTFVCGNDVISHKVMEGKYPNWRLVIPKNNNIRVTVNCDELKDSLKRLGVLSNVDFVKLSCSNETKKMGVELQDIDYAISGDEEIDLIDYSGDNICIGFNVNNLLQVLGGFDGDVTIEMADSNKAAVIESNNTTTLLMPVTI